MFDLSRNTQSLVPSCRLDRSGSVVEANIVDLEWAGKEGEARYPAFMNHASLTWPPGAEEYAKLSRTFDATFLETTFAKLTETSGGKRSVPSKTNTPSKKRRRR